MRAKISIPFSGPLPIHCKKRFHPLQVKKDMLSLYQKYAPLWEREEVERSERWDAYLSHFETMYQPEPAQQ